MTISCPRCGTRYRRPTRARDGEEERFRCTRCKLVFPADPDDPGIPLFEREETEEPEVESFAFDDERDEEEAEPPARETARPRRSERASAKQKEAPAETGSGVTRFALRALLFVAGGYAIFSIYLFTHADEARRIMGSVPLIGGWLAETRLDTATVQLASLKGEYQRVQDDQLVFVISGVAINNSPVAVKGIQIEGRVLGSSDDRRVVFCGTTPPDVHGLTAAEIQLLQSSGPPKEWSLGPGEQTSFLIAFVNPRTDLQTFSAEVVAVQVRRREAPTATTARATPS